MAKQGKLKAHGEVRLLDYPKLGFTKHQKAEVTLKVCCSESYYPEHSQEPVERQDIIHLKVFGKSGEALARTVTKGMRISFEGTLRIERWEKEGVYNCMPVIAVSEWSFIDNKATNQAFIEKHGLAQAPVLNNGHSHQSNPNHAPAQDNTPPAGYENRPIEQSFNASVSYSQEKAGHGGAPAYPAGRRG